MGAAPAREPSLDPAGAEPGDKKKGAALTKRRRLIGAGIALAGIAGVVLFERSKGSSSTTSSPATGAVSAPADSPGYGVSSSGAGAGSIQDQLDSISSELSALQGEWVSGSGASAPAPAGTSAPTPAPTPTIPIAPAPPPAVGAPPSAPLVPGQVDPGGAGEAASDAPGGGTILTGGYSPSEGWAPGSTELSPSGLETVSVGGGGPSAPGAAAAEAAYIANPTPANYASYQAAIGVS